MNLNKQQQRFVQSSNKKVLVSANAGSGKTSTMITKIMDIIKHGESVDNIMAVTFTNAAANDIKQKLFDSLLSEMQKVSGEERNRLSEELDKINVSSIGTLHSICKKIIEKYYYIIDMNPNFSVATGSLIDNLKDVAMKNVMDRITLQGDKEFYPLFEQFNGKRNLNNLYNQVYLLTDFLNAIEDPEKWLANQKKDMSFYFDYVVKAIKNKLNRILQKACSKLNQSKNLDVSILVEYYGGVVSAIGSLLEITGFDKFANALFSISIAPVSRKRKGFDDVLYLITEASDFHASMKAELENMEKEILGTDPLLLKDRGLGSVNTVDLLVKFTRLYQEEFQQIKKDRNIIDFHDFETFAYKILQNEEVSTEIKNKYRYVFVDEYQDINYKQDAIIDKMNNGKNLFMIGDVKQCIYTFRLTTPEIFLQKYHAYFNKNKEGELISFNKNYRSEPEILNFANSIFDNLITEETIGIDYKGETRLEGEKAPSHLDVPAVKMLLMDKQAIREDVDLNSSEFFEEEGKIIVNEIADLIKNGSYVDQNGQLMPINYRDIAILFRDQKENVQALYNQLSLAGIPVSVKLNKVIFDCPQVMQIINLMKVINNSFDDYALATVLLSPLCGCTEQELADIRAQNCKEDFYKVISNCENKKIKEFFAKLDEYRFRNLKKPVAKLLEEIINENSLFTIWASLPEGAGIVTKVKELLNLVDACVDKYDVASILDYIELQQKENSNSKISLNTSENSVKIMSIHESKGLEFPVVFLCSVGKNFNNKSQSADMIITRNLGIGMKSYDLQNRKVYDTIQHRACIIEKKKEEMDEQVRLLYVALTRPRNLLRIVGAYDFKKIAKFINKVDKSIYNCKNILELLLKTMTDGEIQKIINHVPVKLNNGCYVDVYSKLENIETKNDRLILSEGNKQIEKALKKCYDFVYENKVSIATKNTVSSILKEEVDYTNVSDTTLEVKGVNEFNKDAAEVGTKYHAVMELLTYNETKEDVKNMVLEVFGIANEKVVNEIFNAVNVIKPIVGDNNIIKEAQFIMNDRYDAFVANSNITDEVMVQGVVDLIIKGENKAIIVDFKTNRNKTESYYKKVYGLQLDVYAKAVQDGMKIDSVEKYIYSFELGKLINI